MQNYSSDTSYFQRPTVGPLATLAPNGGLGGGLGRAMGHSSSKRPSFAWLPLPLPHSPRKGLLTVLLIVGSFLLTWLPTSARHVFRLSKLNSHFKLRITFKISFHFCGLSMTFLARMVWLIQVGVSKSGSPPEELCRISFMLLVTR